MNGNRVYPDETAGPFTPPPIEFVDREDRSLEARAYQGAEWELESLIEMYKSFDPADRAQGIPPGKEDRIRTWLDNIFGDDCYNVIVWDGEEAAGHATLVPDGDAYELAIFVLQKYQGAGVGTRLIRALLGHGEAMGVEKVWLTVERWNRAAVALYEKIGFETCEAESFEIEMSLRLAPEE